MISINNLTKLYGDFSALDIESLNIEKGESFGLAGNNGAGKTTMFRSMLDLIQPTSGTATFKDVVTSNSEAWKNFTGSYLDERFLIDFLTAEEYFHFIGKLHSLSAQQVDEFVGQFEGFFHDEILGKSKYLRDFSKGNQKKIGIVAALIGEPEILILDEPFANLDPSTQIKLKALLKKLKEEREVTMLISSHDLNHVADVCERIVVLEHGKIVHDIKTNENTLKELETYFAG
jgi:ABC-2 type transport system ATP-binding protein